MANVPTTAWSELTPSGSDNVSAGDNRIREMKTQIREVINVDHDFPSSGQAADVGQHKKVTLQEQANLGTGAEGVPILGAQTVGGKAELVFTDEDDNDIQLTSGGKLDLGSGRLDNDEALTSRNNAGDGDLNLIKANASDQAVITPALLASGGAILPEITAPATAANQGAVYTKNDGTQTELYFREESNGDEVQITKGGIVNSSNIYFSSATVFSSAAAPTSFTDLNLSATVGANSAIVLLRVENNSANAWYKFRTNGMTDDVGLVSASGLYPGGVSAMTIGNGASGYIIVATDSSGIVEWIAESGATTVVHMVAYIK
jgi:hypothetical protein